MSEVRLSSKINNNTRIWRYMSFDKLVHLLSTSHLFFSPLLWLAESDPFEGYLPSVAFEADASIYRKFVADIERIIPTITSRVSEEENGVEASKKKDELAQLNKKIDDLKKSPKSVFKAITRRIVVNCWHANTHESEAMWKIYSERGKGVAIRTTIDRLKTSLETKEANSVVQIHPVKYLDFFDKSLSPKDCIVDGIRSPLLKRISYEHENEVRAFIVPPLRDSNIIDRPDSVCVPVDVGQLIERILIYPYAKEPFISSVADVCTMHGIENNIIERSKLLSGHDDLLDILTL